MKKSYRHSDKIICCLVILCRRDRAFPKYFYTFLHQYIHSVTESAGEVTNSIAIDSTILSNPDSPEHKPKPKTDADEKIERIYHDLDKISFFLGLDVPHPTDSVSESMFLVFAVFNAKTPRTSSYQGASLTFPFSMSVDSSIGLISQGLQDMTVSDKQGQSSSDAQHSPSTNINTLIPKWQQNIAFTQPFIFKYVHL